jgi:hypothetical protein
MSEKVAFLLDGQEMLTYDRGQDLPEQHKSYLDKMDEHMNEGINLSGDRIVNPDLQQKTQFVALNLVDALQKEDDQTAIMMFTYLVNRMPDLKQAKGKIQKSDSGPKIGIEFIFDEVKPEGQKIEFHPNFKMH